MQAGAEQQRGTGRVEAGGEFASRLRLAQEALENRIDRRGYLQYESIYLS